MFVSFVLRLSRDALLDGVLAGEVEDVGAGTRTSLRSVADLVSFVSAAAGERGAAIPTTRRRAQPWHTQQSPPTT